MTMTDLLSTVERAMQLTQCHSVLLSTVWLRQNQQRGILTSEIPSWRQGRTNPTAKESESFIGIAIIIFQQDYSSSI